MRKLLPRMELGGYASAVLHPLMKVSGSGTCFFLMPPSPGEDTGARAQEKLLSTLCTSTRHGILL
eukprot:scaffold329895_cov52-Tisochrysis_lutea.AAC.1